MERLFQLNSEFYTSFCSDGAVPEDNRRNIDKYVTDFDMDNNLQREAVVDQIFLALHFCSENKLEFHTAEILINLIIDEFQTMITGCYDKNASGESRMSEMKNKFMQLVRD